MTTPDSRAAARFVVVLLSADNPPKRVSRTIRRRDTKRAVIYAQKELIRMHHVARICGADLSAYEVYREVEKDTALLAAEGTYEDARAAFPKLYTLRPGERRKRARKPNAADIGSAWPTPKEARKAGAKSTRKRAGNSRIVDTRRQPSYLQKRLLELRENAKRSIREQKDQES